MSDTIRRFRRLNKLYADTFGFFWLPCPICHQMFGGHECGSRTVNGKVACWKHDDE